MKAYDLAIADGANTNDAELNQLAMEAGYASTKAMLNDLDWWSRDVAAIKADLRAQIKTPAE